MNLQTAQALGRSLLVAVGVCLAALAASPNDASAQPSRDLLEMVALSDADCFEELASIDYGDWSENLEDNRFQHVFQHIDDYPYYRYVGSAFIGLKTRRFFPDSIRPGRSYWRSVDGRKGVGADKHYSLIQDFAGKAVVEGVSVNVTKSNEFAFFSYDRSASSEEFHLASDARNGLFDVLTTTPNGVEFVGVGRTTSRGSSAVLRLGSPRFLDKYGDWNESYYKNKYLRTVFFIESQVRIAGVDHAQKKLCRLWHVPLVVTNVAELIPEIEDELLRRAEKLHALRVVNNEVPASDEQWRSSYRKVGPEELVHVASVPRSHVGDFAQEGRFGNVAITFTRDPFSDDIYFRPIKEMIGGLEYDSGSYSFYVNGLLSVDGRDLGVAVDGYFGDYGICCDEDTEALKFQDFKKLIWPNNISRSRGPRPRLNKDTGKFWVECGSEECNIFVRKKLLRTF